MAAVDDDLPPSALAAFRRDDSGIGAWHPQETLRFLWSRHAKDGPIYGAPRNQPSEEACGYFLEAAASVPVAIATAVRSAPIRLWSSLTTILEAEPARIVPADAYGIWWLGPVAFMVSTHDEAPGVLWTWEGSHIHFEVRAGENAAYGMNAARLVVPRLARGVVAAMAGIGDVAAVFPTRREDCSGHPF